MIRFIDALAPLIGWAVIIGLIGWAFIAFVCGGGVCR